MAQLPSQSHFGDYADWPGRDVLDSGGERLGGVREIYLDRETGQPEWVLVDVDGDEARFVPLADAAVESSRIRVAHTASTIRNAPGIGAEPRIDQSEERRLYEHYGLGYSAQDSGSGLPAESSWSDVAPKGTIDAPPPAEPPSPAELGQAEIPEPPAATDRASEYETFVGKAVPPPPVDDDPSAASDEPAGAAEPSTADEPVGAAEPSTAAEPGVGEPITAGEPSEPFGAEPARDDDPSAAIPGATPFTPPAGEPLSPPPPVGETGGDSVAPADEAPATPPPAVPPASTFTPPAAEPRSSWTPPRQPEPAGGALARLRSRPGGIVAGVAIAAVLLMIIRRLR
ncbi:MAG TPA: PRC-barrel domain-containing protein [Solirubrobacter sp.]|nr:PRC-barrel domain-containing protein [Solirubrobacter sp.]